MRVAFPLVAAGTGSDAYTMALAKGLARTGIDVEVLPFGYSMELAPWLQGPSARRQLQKFDLIHCNGDHGTIFHCAPTPMVITLHHNVFDPHYREHMSLAQKCYQYGLSLPRIRRASRLASAIVYCSRYTEQSFRSLLGELTVPQQVIYNCVDTDVFVPATGTKNGDVCELLFVGSPSRRKGAHLLAEIMHRLGPGYRLTCVSRVGFKGWDMDNINVVQNASLEELVRLYQRSHLLLFPTLLEGFGYAVAEAMACGLPVVSSDNSAIPELIVSGKGGWLCETQNIDAYVERVRQLWASAEMRADMGAFNHERAKRLFSEADWAQSYLDLYNRIL